MKKLISDPVDFVESAKDYLRKLESELGDGDHGVSMTIGMRAAARNRTALQHPTPEVAFNAVSEAFADEVGIYEEAFAAAGDALRNKRDSRTSIVGVESLR